MSGPGRALIAAAALAILAAGPAPAPAQPAPAQPAPAQPTPVPATPGTPAVVVDQLGAHVWQASDADFGGFSGLEMSDDGARYWALSDRGTIRWGSVERDAQGRIAQLTTAGTARLQDSKGGKLQPGYLGDAEGLAIDARGRMFVSFEGLDRVARFDDPDQPATPLPKAPPFASLRRNAGLEALAVTPAGDLLVIPEDWAETDPGFPVWRFRDGAWSTAYRLPRDPRWAPVGADVGPDGKLYVLERDFRGLMGFASRVRRYAMTDDALGPPELLIQSVPMQYDNLEGIAVWADAQGIRITLISDDNFLFVQRNELVEFRIREGSGSSLPAAAFAAPIPSALD